jgi:hypothetical protein
MAFSQRLAAEKMTEELVEKVVDFSEVIVRAKAAFLEGVRWKQNAGCLFIDKDGRVGGVDNHVCHASLRGRHNVKVIINGLMIGTAYGTNPGRVLRPEIELWFVDYILNRSPYSQIFIEKDAEKALAGRVTVVSGDHPGNLVGAGLVALRRLWEYVFVAQAAYDLARQGVNEDLAFYLGHLMRTKNNASADDSASWDNCQSGHCSINPAAFGWENLRRFLDHTPKNLNSNYSEGGNYTGYDYMYGEHIGGSVYHYIRENFPKHLYKEQAASPSLNPFLAAKKVDDDSSTTYAKAIEVMATWAKDHLMEKIYA